MVYIFINALPILYKKVTNRSLLEDGVVLIDLENNSSWRGFLKLLSKNKAGSTILFLDSDTQNQDSNSKITRQSLQQIGFGEDFITNSVFFAGNQEFEDSFSNQLICRCLNANWSKKEGYQWEEAEIEGLRADGKFSEKLIKMVGDYKRVENMAWNYVRKSDFGKVIAESITRDEINQVGSLNSVINRIEEIIK